MYLSDNEIKGKWEELKVECDCAKCDIDCMENIQPCSIDFCLSNVFWEPIKHKTIDLRKSSLLELAPRRYWRKQVLHTTDHIILKPGKLLLGRLAAKFTIPNDCAGKIVGRSSFARLGLGIHCTGEFINPGYRGHMPLELFNYSPNPIKIYPYIPICQVMLIRLSSIPSKFYGEEELHSKYMDDDGGPSYWWRDKRIRSLQDALTEKSIELYVQEKILGKIGIQEPDIIERFETLVEKKPQISTENAEHLLDEFTKSEERLQSKEKIFNGICKIIFPLVASASIGMVFITPFTTQHYILWGSTIISLFPFIWALKEVPKQYLSDRELSALQNEQPENTA